MVWLPSLPLGVSLSEKPGMEKPRQQRNSKVRANRILSLPAALRLCFLWGFGRAAWSVGAHPDPRDSPVLTSAREAAFPPPAGTSPGEVEAWSDPCELTVKLKSAGVRSPPNPERPHPKPGARSPLRARPVDFQKAPPPRPQPTVLGPPHWPSLLGGGLLRAR